MANIITPTGTLSYPHLHEAQPGQKPGDKPKYSAAVVFPAGTDLSALRAAELAAAIEKFGKTVKVGGNKEISTEQAIAGGILRSAIRTDWLAKGYAEGSAFINVRSERKPGCVYSHPATAGSSTPAVIPAEKIKDELYPGAQVKVAVNAFGYEHSGNRGISFALNAVQKVGEGDRLDSHVPAENLFVADLTQAPADLAQFLS